MGYVGGTCKILGCWAGCRKYLVLLLEKPCNGLSSAVTFSASNSSSYIFSLRLADVSGVGCEVVCIST